MKLYCFTLILFGLLSCKKDTNKNATTQLQDSLTPFSGSVQDTVNKQNTDRVSDETIKENDSLISEYHTDVNTVKPVRDSTKYYIYLTLDDGPQLPGTRNCKKILEKNNIRATFFMVGLHNAGTEREKLVDSINNDPLFILTNHSNTHGFRNKYSTFYKNPKGALQDFITAESKLNLKHKIARLPGRNTWAINKKLKGESSAYMVARKLDSIGYSVFGWDLEWDFVHGNVPVESATEMVKKVEHTLKNGNTYSKNSIVILVHDRMFDKPQYADSLTKFITALKKNDKYIFDTLDNFPVSNSQ